MVRLDDRRIYQRGETWWIRYWHRGQQYRESSKSTRKTVARDLLDARLQRCGKGGFISPTNEARVTMEDLFKALETDYANNGRRSARTLTFRLAHLRDAFGQDRAQDLKGARIAEYVNERLAAQAKRATVNRELAALRRALKLAVRQERISSAPAITMLAENNARQGFVNPGDFETLVVALPEELRDLARFGYATGWRVGEIISLDWSDVDRTGRRITLRREHSKNAQPRVIPYGAVPALAALMERRWQAREYATQTGPGLASRVFHRRGKPILDFRGAWRLACKTVGRPGLLFHDLRRSAVRNLVGAGVDERVAMQITGHKTRAVFDRYRIVDEQDISAALAKTEAAASPARTVIPMKAAAEK